jgi:tRNA U34 5-carboxymethylaminomethyl modifying GTPase MnmE/TrmE
MSDPVPVLAIMGHPNAGKSSVVATLTENDRIQIDKRAGTTTTCTRYPVVIDGERILEFIDTPGFQNPSDILEWFQTHAQQPNLAGAFVAAHEHQPLFAHDCDLLRPVAEGAGIILVVDGSKRIKEKDRVEMELLRLTARPRMAILNNQTNVDRHMGAWRDSLNMAFNAVREFNAHRATYDERIRLLAALKTIDQRWEAGLDHTIRSFERDWARRIDQSVESILTLLKKALTLKVERLVRVEEAPSQADIEAIQATLLETFQERLRRLESETQAEIRAHFRHSVWNPPGSVLSRDLFSEEVQQTLGLNRSQLALAGAAAGALTGGVIDLGVGGLSLGTGMLLGAITGGVLGAFGREGLAKIDIERRLGIQRLSMGPVHNPKFPFVLLDRSLLYCARAMNWSHGRQAADESAPNRVPDREPRRRTGFTESLPTTEQKTLARYFAAARRGKEASLEPQCREILAGILHGLSTSAIDARDDL